MVIDPAVTPLQRLRTGRCLDIYEQLFVLMTLGDERNISEDVGEWRAGVVSGLTLTLALSRERNRQSSLRRWHTSRSSPGGPVVHWHQNLGNQKLIARPTAIARGVIAEHIARHQSGAR